MIRELVHATPRLTMSRSRRHRVLQGTDYRCAEPSCSKALTVESAEIDHIVQLWMGGSETDDNLQALCAACHAEKTAHDATIRAKTKRLIEGPKPSRRPLRSRGFDKRLTKPINGPTRPRKERSHGD